MKVESEDKNLPEGLSKTKMYCKLNHTSVPRWEILCCEIKNLKGLLKLINGTVLIAKN